MSTATLTRATAGLAAVITGVMLIGTTGLTFAFGWALWAVGLAVLLAAVPSAGGGGRRRRRGRAVYAARRPGAVSATRAQRAWPVVKSVRIFSSSESTR
jgi:hypothetical protein